jgi:hypothetical protein
MESVKRQPRLHRRHFLTALALSLAASCVSCGPQVIEGRPPFIGISDMRLQPELLIVDFRIANQNGVAMTIEAIEIAVRVGEAELVREDRPLQLAIDANSAEELRVERQPGQQTVELLDSLEDGTVPSLPFDLAGRVRTIEDGFLAFEQKGHLYTVPGRPGQFRSAVTQAQELRRDDRL